MTDELKVTGTFTGALAVNTLARMPRVARHAPGGLVYHVLNRANGRLRLFKSDGDYLAFERVLLEAASRFGQFAGPVRVLWGEDDPYFPLKLGRQLSEAFPDGTLTTVPAGRTFLPLDHPDQVASEIVTALTDKRPARPAR